MKYILAFALLISTIVIPLGAFTRLSDAGLGCPDWPGCYGFIDFRNSMAFVEEVNEQTPGELRGAHKTWPEMVHRYFASSLGLFIMILAIAAFFKRKTEHSWGALPYVLFVLVCFQGALGMWTVTMKLYPPTVVAHLYGGFATFTLLFLLAVRIFAKEWFRSEVELAKLKWMGVFTLAILTIQIGLGGWMSANYAALVCTELPICEAGWMNRLDFVTAFSASYEHGKDYEFGLLDNGARTTIHVMHRFFALFATVMIVGFVYAVKRRSVNDHVQVIANVVLALLVVQVALGLSNVVFMLPLPVATAHNGVGALLIASLSLLLTVCFRARD